MTDDHPDSVADRLAEYYGRNEFDHSALVLVGLVVTFVSAYVGLWLVASVVVGPVGLWVEFGTHLFALLLAGVVSMGLFHVVGVLTRPAA